MNILIEKQTPIISHSQLLLFLSLLFFGYVFVVIFFVAEKKLSPRRQLSLKQIFKLAPKYFTNVNLRKFFIYILLMRFCMGFYGEAMLLKYINQGLSRVTIVLINSIVHPLVVIGHCVASKYIKQGSNIQYFQKISTYGFFITCCNFMLLIYFHHSKNLNLVSYLYLVVHLTMVISEQAFLFMFAFVNTIVDEELGSSSITLIMCIWNFTHNVPNSIGLKTLRHVNFFVYEAFFVGLHGFMVLSQRKTAKELDEINPQE